MNLLTLPNDLPANRPVVFWDFDGVYNWHGTSRNQRKKNQNLLPGYNRRVALYVEDGSLKSWFDVEWSAELVNKVKTLHADTNTTWVWLTTWLNHTHKVDNTLNVTSDYTADWDAYPQGRFTDEQIEAYRNEQKLKYVTAFTTRNPDTPWVWVDDSATNLWTPQLNEQATAPHLVLTPDEKWGVNLEELNQLTDFLHENKH